MIELLRFCKYSGMKDSRKELMPTITRNSANSEETKDTPSLKYFQKGILRNTSF